MLAHLDAYGEYNVMSEPLFQCISQTGATSRIRLHSCLSDSWWSLYPGLELGLESI